MEIEDFQRELLRYRDKFYGPQVKEVRVTPDFARRLRDLATYSVTASARPLPVLNTAYGTPVIVDESVASDPGYKVVMGADRGARPAAGPAPG